MIIFYPAVIICIFLLILLLKHFFVEYLFETYRKNQVKFSFLTKGAIHTIFSISCYLAFFKIYFDINALPPEKMFAPVMFELTSVGLASELVLRRKISYQVLQLIHHIIYLIITTYIFYNLV